MYVRRLAPAGLLVLAGLCCSGCVSLVALEASDIYYTEGPGPAIETLEYGLVRQQDRHLAAMELAISLQELGYYQDSNAELLRTAAELRATSGAGDAAPGLLVSDEAGTYRGEYFEQVYLHTMAMANSLAMQDVEAAAKEAAVALETMAALPCDTCQYPFTRYLAALSFAFSGQGEKAEEVLIEAVAESPHLPFLEQELEYLLRDPAIEEEAGFAPPPELVSRGRRDLYLLLLIGRGPEKIEDEVPVPGSHAVAWPRYVPRPPSDVTGAELLVAGSEPGYSVVLTDMLQLAMASLRSRMTGLISKEIGKTATQEALSLEVGGESALAGLMLRTLFSFSDRADLRHWASLPATCQVLRMRIPDQVRRCLLVFTSPSGEQIASEVLDLPEVWQSGPLFVTRRVP